MYDSGGLMWGVMPTEGNKTQFERQEKGFEKIWMHVESAIIQGLY